METLCVVDKDDASVTIFKLASVVAPDAAIDHRGLMALVKRSVQLAGHATSIALEAEFWSVLDEMARLRGLSLAGLLIEIDAARGARPLASTCRTTALAFARQP